jgi:hypothetical protein
MDSLILCGMKNQIDMVGKQPLTIDQWTKYWIQKLNINNTGFFFISQVKMNSFMQNKWLIFIVSN